MKKSIIKYIPLVFLLVIQMTACEGNQPSSQKQKTVYAEAISVFSAYATGNYQEGDSVVFITETGAEDTFQVNYCKTLMEIQPREINADDTIEKESTYVYDTLGVCAAVGMYHADQMLEVAFSRDENGDAILFEIFPKRQESATCGWNSLNISAMSGDYSYTNPVGQTCLLRKGEGIIQFADTLGHTWTKK